MTSIEHDDRAPWEDPYEHADPFDEEPVPGDALPPLDEEEAPHSWRPVDLEAVLDGTAVRPFPDVGARSDGVAVLYPGKVHTVSGESEAGKTWFAVAVIIHELEQGNGAGVVDFEDDEIGWVSRLVDAGASPQTIRERFFYIRPTEALGTTGRFDLGTVLHDIQPTVVVLDGITEAMTLHGLDPLKNAEVAQFGLRLPRWIARRGPAVLCTDHLVKSREGSDGGGGRRYALGAVHKLNGLDGAAFIIENRHSFGIDRKGVSTVSLAKDRPAGLRKNARPSKGLDWFADLIVTSRPGEPLEVELAAPAPEATATGPASATHRPTTVMARVSAYLAAAPRPRTGNNVIEEVVGNKTMLRLALRLLVEEGYVAVADGPNRSKLHTSTRPFLDE